MPRLGKRKLTLALRLFPWAERGLLNRAARSGRLAGLMRDRQQVLASEASMNRMPGLRGLMAQARFEQSLGFKARMEDVA